MSTNTRDNWKTQPRGKGGRFLPKNAHPEDLHPPIYESLLVSPSYRPTVPYQERHKPLWMVIVGYTLYLALCFGAGVLGALVGVHL